MTDEENTDKHDGETLSEEDLIESMLLIESSGWTRTYDDDGNVLTETDLFGNTWTFTYDSNGLLMEVAPDGVTWTYDENGYVVSYIMPDGTIRLL